MCAAHARRAFRLLLPQMVPCMFVDMLAAMLLERQYVLILG